MVVVVMHAVHSGHAGDAAEHIGAEYGHTLKVFRLKNKNVCDGIFHKEGNISFSRHGVYCIAAACVRLAGNLVNN